MLLKVLKLTLPQKIGSRLSSSFTTVNNKLVFNSRQFGVSETLKTLFFATVALLFYLLNVGV
jgi:hypothetical protein